MIFLTNNKSDTIFNENPLYLFEVKFHQTFRVNRRLKIYLADPNNEKHVHNMRTSLRRLDTCYFLLPKKLRKRNRKKIQKYKDFFRANSKIRDIDIIVNKVITLAKGAPDITKLQQQLQRKRQKELRQSIKLANALVKVSPIDVKGIPSDKIELRIDRMINTLSERIEEMLTLVLSDDTKKDELHTLRKNCKKLRYIFEILPVSYIKKYRKKVIGAIRGKDLKKMQRTLGAIRDSDITIEYFQNSRSVFTKQLVVKENAKRNRLYREFIKYMKE